MNKDTGRADMYRAIREIVDVKTPFFLFAATILAACAATTPSGPPMNVTVATTAAPSAAPATPAMPAASAATTAAAPASASDALLRLAKLAGYHTRKLPQGTTVFCKKEAHLGSRFSTESCIDDAQLQEFLIRAQDQRDKLTHRRETGTNNP